MSTVKELEARMVGLESNVDKIVNILTGLVQGGSPEAAVDAGGLEVKPQPVVKTKPVAVPQVPSKAHYRKVVVTSDKGTKFTCLLPVEGEGMNRAQAEAILGKGAKFSMRKSGYIRKLLRAGNHKPGGFFWFVRG